MTFYTINALNPRDFYLVLCEIFKGETRIVRPTHRYPYLVCKEEQSDKNTVGLIRLFLFVEVIKHLFSSHNSSTNSWYLEHRCLKFCLISKDKGMSQSLLLSTFQLLVPQTTDISM